MLTPTQFELIKEEAYRSGIPRGYEGAIAREYLQCETLAILSELPESRHLALIGGTGLRLLYDLDRFSEDLDFDHFGKNAHQPIEVFTNIASALSRRGYSTKFKQKTRHPDQGGNLVFQNFLFQLGLTPHHDETLKVKLEYTTTDAAPPREIRTLNRFGFVAQILTLPLPVLCARKAATLFERKRLLPRDLYDLTWFFSRRITPDLATLQSRGFESYAAFHARIEKLYTRIQPKLAEYERDLLPLLINPDNAKRIRYLPALTKNIILG